MSELTNMMNIGKEMAKKLNAVGIDSLEKLIETGSKQAFLQLRQEYPNVCLVHLYRFWHTKEKSFDDCQHIAAAILAGCDIIISWNFKHIVNVKTVKSVKVITTLEGYKDLLIYPPSVLLEEGDDDE
ncbi:hypothetical protein D7V86_21280 [bacterium D16-51]|nr:hypothetical protein D7V96_17525 [bacterium D16-59]RKI55680.1 hypothetical protein D7V86_21280 [bacterium D16-51]